MTAMHAPAAHLLAAPVEGPVERPVERLDEGPAERLDEQAVSWLSPEAKLWVASRAGEFAGFVEFRDGHYEVTDALGAQLEPRGTLRDAKSLIDEPLAASRASTTLMYLAMGAGATAVSSLAVGLGLIRLG